MKSAVKLVAVALVVFMGCASASFAALKVASTQQSTASGDGAVGVRAQGVVTIPTAKPDGDAETLHAVAIVRLTATILIRDTLNISNGLSVNKHVLTSGQAWGDGQPNGYNSPPPNNTEGPWVGLMWPYRDQNDYFNGPFDPPGNDIGDQFDFQPALYGFANITGIARGGPTDNAGPPSQNTPDWLLRGVDGNGVDGPASYFDFDIHVLSGDPNRAIELKIVGASARVVVVDDSGNYSEMQVGMDDFDTMIQLPEPASASVVGMLVIGALTRRRAR